MEIRKFVDRDLPALMRIWNEVVDEGQAFPQEEQLTTENVEAFFASQSFTGVALEDGETMADYYVDFGSGDAVHPLVNNEALMITKAKRDVPLNDGKLYLTDELFALDALILDDVQTRSVCVKSDKSAHCIRMDFEDFPYLGIWSKYTGKPTNYVCIEPWSTLPDAAYLDHALENKIGVRCLKPGESETLTFSTTITE